MFVHFNVTISPSLINYGNPHKLLIAILRNTSRFRCLIFEGCAAQEKHTVLTRKDLHHQWIKILLSGTFLLITKVKIVDVYPITNTNQPKSVSCHVIPRSLNFSECLHFEISSDLLLRQDEGSLRRINSFSDKQRSHILEPHL